jgi:hypothetical protein
MAQLTCSLYDSATVEGDQQLAVEIGTTYLAFVLGTHSLITGFEYYDADDNDLEELLHFAKNKSRILHNSYSEARVYYNLEEAVLVPVGQFNTTIASEFIDLAFGNRSSCRVNVENVNVQPGIVNVYRSIENWQEIISRYFRAVTKRHLYSKLVEDCMADKIDLSVIFYKDSFVVTIAPGQQLKMVRRFGYNSDADVIYHLLNTCKQTGTLPEALQINITGFIEENAPLALSLTNYFGAMVVGVPHHAVPADQNGKYPSHYFTHFFNLLS